MFDDYMLELWHQYVHCEKEEVQTRLLEIFIHECISNKEWLQSLPNEDRHYISFSLASHLLKLIYSTINDSISNNVNVDKAEAASNENQQHKNELLKHTINDANNEFKHILTLRNFLVQGVGGQILQLLIDLDIKSITNGRELCHTLASIFPTTTWNSSQESYLHLTNEDCQGIIKTFEKQKKSKSGSRPRICQFRNSKFKNTVFETRPIEDFEPENFKIPEPISSSQLAKLIQTILFKLVLHEHLTTSLLDSITIHSLEFCLENLQRFNLISVFEANDQNIVRLKMLQLLFICLRNLFKTNFDDSAVMAVFKKTVEIGFKAKRKDDEVKSEQQSQFMFAILSVTLYIFTTLCSRKNKDDKIKIFLTAFQESLDFVWIALEEINETQFLFKTQELLVQSMTILKGAAVKKKKKKKRKADSAEMKNHHKEGKMTCLVEQVLLETLALSNGDIRQKLILYFRRKGICCCNATENSIRIFINLKQHSCLSFMNKQILAPILTSPFCIKCKEKKSSLTFKRDLFYLLKKLANESSGADLKLCLFHLNKLSSWLKPHDYCTQLLNDVVLPLFKREKISFLIDLENSASKNILICCISIFLSSIREESMIKTFFTEENIEEIRDLCLVPDLAHSMCHLLMIAIQNSSLLGDTAEEQHALSSKVTNLIMNNTLYLIDELKVLFKQLGLEKEIERTNSVEENDDEYEILEKSLVAVKQALKTQDVLQLNALYCNLISRVARFDELFQEDFINYIYNFHSNNILFVLVFNSINAIFLPNEINSTLLPISAVTSLDHPETPCASLSSLSSDRSRWSFINDAYDLDYNKLINALHTLAIDPNDGFLAALSTDNNFLYYKVNRECFVQLSRDFSGNWRETEDFLGPSSDLENLNLQRVSREGSPNEVPVYQKILSNVRQEGRLLGERFGELIKKISRNRDDAFENSRKDLIQEIRKKKCRKYLTAIAQHCFELLIKISKKVDFCPNMSKALLELKSLLLQQTTKHWSSIDNGMAILSTLQMLLKVAEVKRHNQHIMNSSILSQSTISEFNLNDASHSNIGNIEESKLTEELDNFLSDLDSLEDESLKRNDVFGEDDDNDKTEEIYLTADENYDADEEYFSYNESDCTNHINYDPVQRTCSYPQPIPIENSKQQIYRLVVDILIELSQKCVEDANFWTSILARVAVRLHTMKHYLGGPLFLIKGFTPVLKSNHPHLEELQKTIVELISDLESPEAFMTYMGLLAANDPPVKVLLPRLVNLCDSAPSITPFMGIDYPTFDDSSTTSSCDHSLNRYIKVIHEYHLQQTLASPFTDASLLIPLNYVSFNTWNNQGCTISTWLQVKSGLVDTKSAPNPNNVISTHLVSVGSDRLMLSIKLNSDRTLEISLLLPSYEMSENKHKKTSPEKENEKPDELMSIRKEIRILNKIHDRSANKENINLSNIRSENNEGLNTLAGTSKTNNPNVYTRGLLRAVNKMGIVTTSTAEENAKRKEIEQSLNILKLSRKTKLIKLEAYRWTHFCISVQNTEMDVQVVITKDGLDEETVIIPLTISNQLEKPQKLNLLCIGSNSKDPITSSSITYSLSNVVLFKTILNRTDLIASLFALGPDCVNFVQCATTNNASNFGLLDFRKPVSDEISMSECARNLKELRNHLIITYSAEKTNSAIAYKSPEFEYGENLGMFVVGKPPKSSAIPSIHRSVILSGGISTLLFMFGRVVELSSSPKMHSSALYLLLKIAHSNGELLAEFEEKKYFNLIAHVFKHQKCSKGGGMLKAIMDVACGNTLIVRKSADEEQFHIATHSNVSIQHPKLLLAILEHYSSLSIWVEDQQENVLDLLFYSILVMIRDKHPNRRLNFKLMIDLGFLDKIMRFCKIYLTNSTHAILITKSSANSIVHLIRLLSTEPTIEFLNEIIQLLLLMHHPSESFVTHDRAKFYFLLAATKPVKTKKLNISINTKYFGLRTKIREKSSETPSSPTFSIKSATKKHHISEIDNASLENFQKLQRSISMDVRSLDFADRRNSEHHPSTSSIQSRSINLGDLQISSTTQKSQKKRYEPTEMELDAISKAFKRKIGTPKKVMKRLTHPKKLLGPILKTQSKSVRKLFCNQRRNLTVKIMQSVTNDGVALSLHFEQLMNSLEADGLGNHLETAKSKNSLDAVVDTPEIKRQICGSVFLQEHLFLMLHDCVQNLGDDRVSKVLQNYVQMEILIVLASHQDANVRAAIVKLIKIVVYRTSSEQIAKYTKLHYWHHLGNQLALNPVNSNLIENLMDWVLDLHITLESVNRYLDEGKMTIRKVALVPLIAVLPQCVHDPLLLRVTLKFLRIVIGKYVDNFQYIMESGLIASIIKTLVKLQLQSSPNPVSVDSIRKILKVISFKAMTSAGTINWLWDLLHSLKFMERNRKITKASSAIREMHVFILSYLLMSCVTQDPVKTNSRYIYHINIANCTLHPAEMKTRFNLVYDKCIQFVVSSDLCIEISENEMKLIKFIIQLTLSGFTHGSSLLLWGLDQMRPMDLKVYIIKKLVAHEGNIVTAGYDLKMLKVLANSFYTQFRDAIIKEDLAEIVNFCGLENTNASWEVAQALEKIESMRMMSNNDQDPVMEKSVYKHEAVVQQCVDGAMKLTRDVIDIQNKERRVLMKDMKKSQEMDFYREWYELIQRMTHEGAPFHNSVLYPTSWELDDTEGPLRQRQRFKRTSLKIEKKFFMDDFKHKAVVNQPLLSFLLSSSDSEKYTINDQIIYNLNAKFLTLEIEIEGEVIITDFQLIFLANKNVYSNSIISSIQDILEIRERRYRHREVALEFFLRSSKVFMVILETNYDRDIIKKFFADKIELHDANRKPEYFTQKWKDNQITNYEYLMELNKLAGRSFNDLMQYPVFPWILSDYESPVLNLTSDESFRKLEKPIAIQHANMEEKYVESYYYLEQGLADNRQIGWKPYHYTSHYSNSGTVLHFLVRIPPFTSMFLLYQDHNFDIPDRTFHALATTWGLASKESATDVKEMVPEFFYLPEMLENQEGFNFGRRQSGDLVDSVALPPWSAGSSRFFTLIHRQALESDAVRIKLNCWIDLIFGFKQKGKAAVEAINVFHPTTYNDFPISSITDPVERSAFETMIKTYGQMPKQLFDTPHPKSKLASAPTIDFLPVLSSVKGLKWGIYTGSPQLPKPKMIFQNPQSKRKIDNLMGVLENNKCYSLTSKCSLMQGSLSNSLDVVLWGEPDNIIRIKTIAGKTKKKANRVFHASSVDPLTACGTHVKHGNLWFGHESGRITVYKRKIVQITKNSKQKNKSMNSAMQRMSLESIIGINLITPVEDLEEDSMDYLWSPAIVLIKHTGAIVNIKISPEYSIVVSIGLDKNCVIWDSNKFEYVRTIEPPSNSLDSTLCHLAISPTLGDIVTIFTPKERPDPMIDIQDESFEVTENNGDDFISVNMKIEKSQIRLHTINASYVVHKFTNDIITAVCYSFIKEGTGVNVVAVGFDCGAVRLYSSWNLEFVREIDTKNSIENLLYTTNHQLVIQTNGNLIQIWESEGLIGKAPDIDEIVITL